MKNHWQFLLHVDNNNVVDPFTNHFFSNPFRVLYHLFSFVDHSKHVIFPRIYPFGRFSKYPFRLESHNLLTQVEKNVVPNKFNVMGSLFCNVKHFFSGYDDLVVSFPVLSLAATVKPALDNLVSNMVGSRPVDQTPCDVENRGCVGRSFPEFSWMRHAVEPITGIEFPGVLNNVLDEEVLVGTGSKTVTIIKIKSLKLYAFGFYVHPYSVCHKLGSKYASVSAAEVKDHRDFYADLLREDIGMTVRLVVNCNGMKINAVKDAFEKSLRDRLVKTNPETDFKCISTFGSFFTKDIPLPVGTIIDFRRTADGQLITEIGGNQIGAVRSRELCRAFFDMYLGEVPVSKQTKEEIGSNVASIVRRC